MESREFTRSDITWVVRIMYENPDLVESRERLCMGLGLSISELTDITRDKPSDTRVFLALALNTWISKFPGVTFQKLDEILKTENFNSTADEITESLPQYPPNSAANFDQNCPRIWFDVPEDVHMFTGRVEDMNELHESIVAQNLEDGKNDMTVITAVCGMGGVGKTSLTIHYAWTFFKEFYVNVIWINSETKNTIADSFNRLARSLGQNISVEFCEIISNVYKSIGNAKTLIIFDNVECYEDIKSYIPIRSPNAMRPYVLLTSRNRNWHLRTHLIDLNVFRTEESIEFLKSFLSLKTEEELEQAEVISDALQNLPLAIRQAGAYIKMQYQQKSGKQIIECLKSYMELFKSNSVEALEFDHSSHTADIYEKTIFSTWTVNMEKLTEQNRLTRTIIELISYLNSDNIPIELFYKIPQKWQGGCMNRLLRKSVVEITDVNSAINLLTDFSLIRRVDLGFISVHRLLQKVVRTQVEQKYKESRLDRVIELIKIPLFLNNHDHYEYVCLLHSLSIKDHIPRQLLYTKRVRSLLFLIKSKQFDSVNNRLKLLQELLEQDKYDEAIESYERTRKFYLGHGTGMKNHIDERFTLRFVNLICLEILREFISHGINTRTRELGQIIKNVFSDFNVSLDDEESINDSGILRVTIDRLHKAVENSAEEVGRSEEIFSIVHFIHRTLSGEGTYHHDLEHFLNNGI